VPSAVKKNDWPALAERLAGLLPQSRLHPSVTAWAEEDAGAARGSWAVAFSGGADSLALLLLLWAHWPERRARLLVLHFNHRLRGRASTADAQFCARVCAALGVRYVSAKWIEAYADASEAEARAARFGFFQRELSRRRIRALWFGHQQEDIAETLLMRLARGSGAAGLAAPRPLQLMPAGRVHVRPLLTLKKNDLCAALTEVGAVWREDASNATSVYQRNRMRHSVLPAWKAAVIGRDALSGAALSRELLDEDDSALEVWVDRVAPLSDDGLRLDLGKLRGLPRAVVRRALRRWLAVQADTGDLSRQGFAALLMVVERGSFTRFSLGKMGLAVIRKGVLAMESPAGDSPKRAVKPRPTTE
jgi:tRNA(Ile)-lysidine synthase